MNKVREVFHVSPILPISKDQDGVSAGFLGITNNGISEISYGGRGAREHQNMYQRHQDSLEVGIDVISNPCYR